MHKCGQVINLSRVLVIHFLVNSSKSGLATLGVIFPLTVMKLTSSLSLIDDKKLPVACISSRIFNFGDNYFMVGLSMQ